MSLSLAILSPFMRNGSHVLPVVMSMTGGDKISIEAEITPATLARVRSGGMAAAQHLRNWAMTNVSLPPEWQAYGLMGRAAAGVAARAASNPLLNLPDLGPASLAETSGANPAYGDALQLLAGNPQELPRLMAAASAARPDPRARALLSAACHLGDCCCGKLQHSARYSVDQLIDKPWLRPDRQIAASACERQAIRSLQTIRQ